MHIWRAVTPLVLLACLGVCLPSNASAQPRGDDGQWTPAAGSAEPPRQRGGAGEVHDRAFFLRMSAGLFSYGFTQQQAEGGTAMFDGVGNDLNFAIGGTLRRDLALHATFFGFTVYGVRYRFDGPGGDVSITREDSTLDLAAFGEADDSARLYERRLDRRLRRSADHEAAVRAFLDGEGEPTFEGR